MSKIFKEALADAKKLKEIAEENAKKAILESVTPRIREFIEEQLLEGEEEHDSKDEIKSGASASQTVDEGDEEQIDEATIKNLLDMIGSKELFESLSSLEEKNILIKAMKTATNKLNNTQKEKIYEISNKINQNIDKLENSKINNNVDTIQENNSMSKNEKYYEIDLKMLREAVEEEADTLEMADRYDEEDDKDLDEDLFEAIQATINFPNAEDDLLDDLEGAELMDFRVEGGDDSEEDEEESEEESEDLDMPDIEGLEDTEEPVEEGEAAMNEVFDVDPELLRQELANIRQQLQEGNVDHHFGGKGESKSGHANAYGGKGPKKVGHQKSFGGGAYGKDAFVSPPQINKLNEAIRKLSRMNRTQGEKLNKYRGAVKTLREQLEDLNLFNAKLLYVNKLLQNKSLTESQKKSVIKALDEAKNVGETKALFKSLTESFASSKNALNESKRFGSSSRVTTSSAAKNAGSDLDRWQKLAGLK
jgi:hypothetical protein